MPASYIYMADSGGHRWQVGVLDGGRFDPLPVGAGTVSAPKLNDPTAATSWQLVITTAGRLQASPIGLSNNPGSVDFVSPSGLLWSLKVSNAAGSVGRIFAVQTGAIKVFFETEFPRGLGYHRLGAPAGFSTVVNQGFSGQEQRNRNWANSRGKWTISLMTPPSSQFSRSRQAFIDLLTSFFLNVGGKADAFRLFDATDHQLTGQQIGIGNGTQTSFQLIRTYVIGGRSYVRNITKPITSSVGNYQGGALPDTVVAYFNGVKQLTGWAIDYTTGLFTFTPAVPNTVVVTADAQYDYPVRFDVDELPIQIEPSNVGGGQPLISINAVPLVEVLPPNY